MDGSKYEPLLNAYYDTVFHSSDKLLALGVSVDELVAMFTSLAVYYAAQSPEWEQLAADMQEAIQLSIPTARAIYNGEDN